MIHIVSIIGARPQFIKAAVLSRLIRSNKWSHLVKETLIHTGQHYDSSMSEIFFKEMEIPTPDIHLSIGGGTHGQMTGNMLIEIEKQLEKLKPDVVVVYGDTNSTLAGALAAGKMHIPIAHIEAGLRSYWKAMPEEQNRILTDHLSKWLFCPTDTAVYNLEKEAIVSGVHKVGDIMYDANLHYRRILESRLKKGESCLTRIKELEFLTNEDEFALATIHRAENTDDLNKLNNIIGALNEFPLKVVLPIHPRTKKVISNNGIQLSDNVIVIEPVGYYEIMELQLKSSYILTDSGGIQKEAFFMETPCLTLRDQTEWVETVSSGWNVLVGADKAKIMTSYEHFNRPNICPPLYGDGNSGELILKEILKSF